MKLKTGLSASANVALAHCWLDIRALFDVRMWEWLGGSEGPCKWGRMWPRQIACRMQLAHFANRFMGVGMNKKTRGGCI